jgi:hypothetical protein
MTRKRWGLVALVAAVLAVSAFVFARDLVDVPFTDVDQVFAVGLLAGDTPLTLAEWGSNPVITRADVDEPDVIGVADPWLVVDADGWHLFFEVIRRRPGAPNNQHGVLGLATSSDSGVTWQYRGVVLEETWHLSYPQVFEHDGTFYMVPESLNAGEVTLYRNNDFPFGWQSEGVLLSGGYTDPTIVSRDGRWWLFATASGAEADDTLRLFSADELTGPYHEHPASPIVTGDVSRARSAGPVVAASGGLVRFAQDNTEGYGRAVRAFFITTLTATEYAEEEASPSAILSGSGGGWNADGMHHVAPVLMPDGSWLAAVDGFIHQRVFGFGR